MTIRRTTSRRASTRSQRTSGSTTSGQRQRRKWTSAATMLPLALGLAGNVSTPLPTPTPTAVTSTSPEANSEENPKGSGFDQVCSAPFFPTETPTDMDNSSCTVSGNGGAETTQNQAKNNFCASGDISTPTLTTLAELVALQAKVQQNPSINFGNNHNHPITNNPGPAKARGPLQELGEGALVQLLGYVKIARQEGAESVNCGSNVPNAAEYHDIHISIVLSPADAECSGVVVEMTPHHRPQSWTPELVNEVAAAGLLVRVTGQRMFDSSHTPCQNGAAIRSDPARISLWEIHPIYKFEVCPQGNCSGGGWVKLEDWTKS